MKKLLLLLSICISVSAIAVAGGTCSKENKCCKSAGANGKACCKAKKDNAETTSSTATMPVDAATPTADGSAPAAPAKSCCKGKKAACTKAQ